jgi:hypothetical protein
MPITAMTGVFGTVGRRTTIRDWMINSFSDTRRYAASNTRGAVDRMRGNYDWNGRFRHFGDWVAMSQSYPGGGYPGEYIQFQGYQGAPDETYGGEGPWVQGDAIVDSIEVVWDWLTNDPVSVTTNISGNGAIQDMTDAAHTDISPPDTYSSEFCVLSIRDFTGGGSLTTVCARRATLTMSCDNKAYVNSCSGGIVKRAPGILDWNMAIVMEQPDSANLSFGQGNVVGISINVNGSSEGFFELNYGIVRGFSDFVVNIETGDIISYTVNIEMCATDDSGTVGHIHVPNTTGDWWPENTTLLLDDGTQKKIVLPDNKLTLPVGTEKDPAPITV